jgi:tetratricopeptide (TPR) repeat protein
MASIVDKYEQILAADPRSRIFVELAKALVDRGEHTRAVEVCQRGLEHHPSSILGRVTWGRALLEAGDAKGAMDQFEIAIALEPSSPYAYNHVGEALLKKALFREALPVLARAVELQPADARVRSWLEDAKRRARGEPPGPAPPSGGVELEDEQTEPYRPIPVVARRTPAASAADTTSPSLVAGSAAPAADLPPAGAPAASAPNAAVNGSAGAAPPEVPAKPPPLPPKPKRPAGKDEPRSVLYMLPGSETRDVIGPAGPAAPARATAAWAGQTPHEDRAEAERIAAQYERELRDRLTASEPLHPSFIDRHRRLLVGGAIALALGAAAGAYLYLDARNSELIARTAASRGRAGLGRDTLGSLREAHRLLSEARRRARGDAEVASLAAQVAGVLAADFGDEEARAVATKLAGDASAGDGAVAAAWLVSAGDAERKEVEEAVLEARPSSAPLLQAIAGRILLRRGELEGGKGRLEIAARSNPPLLRAVSDLGDAALAAGDAEVALGLYGSALAAHPTHPRSVVGAAEARLSLERDLDVARKQLAAVDADPASAPPKDLRPRFEVVYARVLAASGEPGQAAARLQKASESLGESATIAAALAEIQLAARAWDKAEAAAARAVRLEPREVSHRVLLARARIGRGHYREALAATDGQEGRAVRIQRAIARLRLGQLAQAREELERTAKEGKMPAEAAVWYALVDVAVGQVERALPIVEKLAASPSPPPLAHLALGRTLEAKGDAAGAEEAYRAATVREPSAPEGWLALGRFLLARGRAKEAATPLERAVKLDPSDLEARRALGESRLLAGQPSAARADIDFVLMAAPRDAGAYTLLSAAWLAEGQPAEARRAAERAVDLAPRSAAARLAAAKASLASGDRPAARKHAARALRSGAGGDAAADARRILDEAKKGR